LVSSKLKKKFEEITKKLVSPLIHVGVSPNHLTVLGFLLSMAAGYSLMTWQNGQERLIIGGLLILLSGLIDAMDGVLARSSGEVTRFGGFLDSVADRYSDSVVISGLILGGLCSALIGLMALIGSLMVSYSRSRAEAEGVKMAGVGLAERAERMIFLAICSILSYWWPLVLNGGILILGIITHFTVIQRGLYFKKEIEKN
jgi:archaetidylinositol phosphate synthase